MAKNIDKENNKSNVTNHSDNIVERNKALEIALGQIDKQLGKGSIMRMGEKKSFLPQLLPLDITWCWRSPRRVGVSRVNQHWRCTVAEAQRSIAPVAEHVGSAYAAAIGVDIDRLISQPTPSSKFGHARSFWFVTSSSLIGDSPTAEIEVK